MKTVSFLAVIFILIAALSIVGDEPVSIESEIELLMKTDREWATAAGGDNIDSILTFWTDDAVLYNVFGTGQNVIGKDAIKKLITEKRAVPGRSITWTPDEAFVSASGDVGATRGTGELTVPGKDGNPVTIRSNYFNVWKKSKSGRWQCAFETHYIIK